MTGFINLLEINLRFLQAHRVHPTSNVDSDDIRANLVGDRHRRPDRTSLPGMDIRHDSHTASARQLIITHPTDLFNRLILNLLRITDRRIDFSFNFKHVPLLFYFDFIQTFFSVKFFRKQCFCRIKRLRIRSTKTSGAVTRIIGPNESTRITSSVSSSLSYLTLMR